MYKFKTISVEDWKHAVDEHASERAKIMRHKKLAIKALKEVEPFWFPKKGSSYPIECKIPEYATYTDWYVRPFGKAGYFHVCITEAKIWITNVDGLGDKDYPCGRPDWALDTNLVEE